MCKPGEAIVNRLAAVRCYGTDRSITDNSGNATRSGVYANLYVQNHTLGRKFSHKVSRCPLTVGKIMSIR